VTASARPRRDRGIPSPPSAMPRCQSSICHAESHHRSPAASCRPDLGSRPPHSQANAQAPPPNRPQRRACHARSERAVRVSAARRNEWDKNTIHAESRYRFRRRDASSAAVQRSPSVRARGE
jgi:hypothetical protein